MAKLSLGTTPAQSGQLCSENLQLHNDPQPLYLSSGPGSRLCLVHLEQMPPAVERVSGSVSLDGDRYWDCSSSSLCSEAMSASEAGGPDRC